MIELLRQVVGKQTIDAFVMRKINEVIQKVNEIDQAQDQQINNETQLLKTFKTLLGVVDTLQDRVKLIETQADRLKVEGCADAMNYLDTQSIGRRLKALEDITAPPRLGSKENPKEML